jgi:hypothetical protein
MAKAPLQETKRPEVGSLWRDREGNTWRLDEYCDGGPFCRLRGVIRFDGAPWGGATWHCDWMLDLVRKAEPLPYEPEEAER